MTQKHRIRIRNTGFHSDQWLEFAALRKHCKLEMNLTDVCNIPLQQIPGAVEYANSRATEFLSFLGRGNTGGGRKGSLKYLFHDGRVKVMRIICKGFIRKTILNVLFHNSKKLRQNEIGAINDGI